MNLRSIIFVGLLTFFIILQLLVPSRKPYKGRWKHMVSNLGLVGVNNIVLLFIPIIPITVGEYVATNSIGLFNYINIPLWILIPVEVLLLDMVIYFQHRMFHKVDWLWALHSVHHIDPMLDVTSGLRFHPIEILISNFIKVLFVFVFGINPISIIIFEVSLNGFAMFNHTNLKLTPWLENVLSKIVITPALHTIHHSKIRKETNSNYGFSIVLWDVLFKSFTKNGKYTMENINIGVVGMPEIEKTGFPYYLYYPFKK